MAFDYDLFVIGGGSGGVRAARTATATGASVALAEESRMGGTCVIRGCVPKKLMVYASGYGEVLDEARAYGWEIGEGRFDSSDGRIVDQQVLFVLVDIRHQSFDVGKFQLGQIVLFQISGRGHSHAFQLFGCCFLPFIDASDLGHDFFGTLLDIFQLVVEVLAGCQKALFNKLLAGVFQILPGSIIQP